MKILLVVFLSAISVSSFAGEIRGLKCENLYLVHENNKILGIDRAYLSDRSFGGLLSILSSREVIPVNNEITHFSDAYESAGTKFSIGYELKVGSEQSSLIISIKSGDHVQTLPEITFATAEGITVTRGLMGMAKIQQSKKIVTDYSEVIVTCHPAF